MAEYCDALLLRHEGEHRVHQRRICPPRSTTGSPRQAAARACATPRPDSRPACWSPRPRCRSREVGEDALHQIGIAQAAPGPLPRSASSMLHCGRRLGRKRLADRRLLRLSSFRSTRPRSALTHLLGDAQLDRGRLGRKPRGAAPVEIERVDVRHHLHRSAAKRAGSPSVTS